MPAHISVEPLDEPVSLDEAKSQLNLESTEDDDFISLLISAARRHVEAHCNRGIIEQTWELVLEAFPHHMHHAYRHHSCNRYGYGSAFPILPCRACDLFIELPHGQLADVTTPVTSVKYIDLNGSEQTLTLATDYTVDAVNVPGRVHLAYQKNWPQPRDQWDAVKVVYTVGWAEDLVPEPIKQAILLLVSQMYEHRTPEVESRAITPVLFSYEALLSPYRLFTL